MVKLKTLSGPPPICISNEKSYRAEQLLFDLSAQNVLFRQKLKAKVKSKSKCMEKVWEKIFNHIFQDDFTVGFKFNLSQSCRARRAVFITENYFKNLFNEF